MIYVPDAPWIGLCREDREERCRRFSRYDNQEEEDEYEWDDEPLSADE